MSEPFIGEIFIVPYNFAPRGWAFCNGQLMPISQNDALFSIVGTTYGGDGQQTFGLPDMRGASPLHPGQGPGLSHYDLGQTGGVETVALTTNQIPAHAHQLSAESGAATTSVPLSDGAVATTTVPVYGLGNPTPMSAAALAASGAGSPHYNRQPFLVLNFIIALEGIFPSRN